MTTTDFQQPYLWSLFQSPRVTERPTHFLDVRGMVYLANVLSFIQLINTHSVPETIVGPRGAQAMGRETKTQMIIKQVKGKDKGHFRLWLCAEEGH